MHLRLLLVPGARYCHVGSDKERIARIKVYGVIGHQSTEVGIQFKTFLGYVCLNADIHVA